MALFSPIQAQQLQSLAATDPNTLFAGLTVPQQTVPSGYNTAVAQIESGGNANAQNPQSSASGLYGITDPTLQGIIKNHPELAGLDKNDPRVINALDSDNAQELRLGTGKQPDATALYAAHFLGGPTAVKFLQADPNAPASSVVPQDFVLRNASTFTGPDGQPLTVAQVMQNWQAKLGGVGATPAAPAASGVGGGPADYMRMFPPASQVFGPLSQSLQDYMQSQPAMWDKLGQMQKDYVQQMQVSPNQRINDVINSYAQGSDAAAGLKNATAGGVLLHSLPNMQPSIQALQNAHQMQLQQRQQGIQAAQAGYQTAAQNLIGQNAQKFENLKAMQGLASTEASYGVNAAKIGLELAKFGNQQATALVDYATKLIPNPETRAQVMSQFTQSGNPTAPLAQNIAVLDGLAKKAQAGGSQIGEFQPGQAVLETSFDPNTGGAQRKVVNSATPAGSAEIANAPQGTTFASLTAPQSNVTVNNAPAGGEGGEGGKGAHTPDQVYSAANQTILAAKAALDILPYLKTSGGTGAITDSDKAREVYTTLKQVLGYDPKNISLRSLYDKLVNQLQVAAILPSMAAIGRGTGMEFGQLLKGQVGAQYDPETQATFLQHLINQAQWDQSYTLSARQAQVAARQANNPYWDEPLFRMQYLKTNPQPGWDLSALEPKTPAQPAGAASPAQNSPLRTIDGKSYMWDGKNWRHVQ